jgi:hypothetical protein
MNPVLQFYYSLTTADVICIGAGLVIAVGVMLGGRALLSRRRRDGARDLDAAMKKKSDPFEQGSTSDRRTAPRRRGNPVAVRISDSEGQVEPVRGWVVDRSAGGLGLELEEEGDVEVGTVLSVRPTDAPDLPWVKIEVRNRQKNGTTWRLGCQFIRPPAWNVLMRFG